MKKNVRFLLVFATMTLCCSQVWGHDPHYGRGKAITTGNGSVYVSTNGTTKAGGTESDTTNGEASYIDWDCSQHSDADDFTFFAFATPVSHYHLKGWSTNQSGTDLSTDEVYTLSGKAASETSTNPTTVQVYAFFEKNEQIKVTYVASDHGSYTATYPDKTITMSAGSASQSYTSDESVTLTAGTAAEGYFFYGWQQTVGEVTSFLSRATTLEKVFIKESTVTAIFLENGTPLIFSVNGTLYHDLNDANAVANSGDKIIVVDDGELPAGNYTIKEDVTLVIPYEETGTKSLTTPEVTTTIEAVTPFRTLKLGAGVHISLAGNLCVSGKVLSGGGGYPAGYTTGPCGVLDMSTGGHIDVEDGGRVYCWGFIKGQNYLDGNNTQNVGTITAKSGSKIRELYTIGDFGGGSYSYAVGQNDKQYRIYPFQSYFVQNIEVPLRIEYGAYDYLYTNVYASYSTQEVKDMPFIGSASDFLFKINSDTGAVTKWYDPTTDHLVIELEGDASLDNLQMTIIITINAKDFDLPLLSNMHFKLKNCDLVLNAPMKLQAGCIVEVPANSSLTLKKEFYVYDHDEWGTYVMKKYFRTVPAILTQYRGRGDGSTNTLDDAKIIADGKIIMAEGGGLYTTASGANVMSHGGGTIQWEETLPANATTYGYTNGTSVTGSNFNAKLTEKYCDGAECTPAKMHNVDDCYTAAKAGTTFTNVLGRWFGGDAKEEKANHTYDFTYINGSADATTEAIYWLDAQEEGHWNNVTADGVTYADTWKGTNEEAGVKAYYCYTTYDQSGNPQEGWVKLTQVGATNNFSGSDNNMYAYMDSKWQSIGSTDDDCLYTVEGVRKAMVGGDLVAVTKNTNPEDGAWHATADATKFYADLSGTCIWKSATKVSGVEKAYVVVGQTYIRYDKDGQGEDWMAVEYEAPYYYTVDAQNLRTYYQYNATKVEWEEASPVARVSSANNADKFFYFFRDAIAAASSTMNPTVTLLADCEEQPSSEIALTSTVGSSEYTLDLNGHTIAIETSIAAPVVMNMNGGVFTITDNSTEKNGVFSVTGEMNARIYAIKLNAGTLNINGGTIAVNNTMEYVTSKITATASSAIYVAAGQKVNINDGTIDAKGCYYPRGIDVAGSTSAKAEVNINGGTINSESTVNSTAHGVYAVGGTINMKGGEINVLTKTTSAYGIYVDASTNNYYATLNMTGGTINATATTNTAIGVFVNGVYTFNNTTPNTIKATYRAVANISGGTINAETLGTTTAYAFQSRGTSTITGGTFNATAKSYTVYGIMAQDGTTTVSGDTKVTVRGTYQCYATCGIASTPDDKTGRPYNPTITINGGTFDVKTTSTTDAYGVYVNGGVREITSTTSGYYAGQYTSVAKAIVNGGTFTVEAYTTSGVGVVVSRAQLMTNTKPNTVKFEALGIAEINGGTFNVSTTTSTTAEGIRSYGTTTVKGGTFNMIPKTTDAYGIRLYGGKTIISGSPEFNVTATEKAYGITAGKEQPADKAGNLYNAEVDVQGGVFNVKTTTKGTAYGVYLSTNSRAITSTTSGYYAGNYANAGTATISGGEFNVETKTTTAYGLYLTETITQAGATGYDAVTVMPKATVTGGSFTGKTGTTSSSYATGVFNNGDLTISGGTFHAHATTTTAYGAYLNKGKATITSGTFEAEADGTSLTKAGNVDVRGIYIVSNCKISEISGVTVDAWANQVYKNDKYNDWGQYVYGIYIGSKCTQLISNSTITARDAVNYTYGIRTYGTTTLEENTITSQTKGGSTAYGLFADATTSQVQGEIIMNSGTVNVTSATSTAFGVYTNYAPVTSTSAIGYSAAYFGTATINGGTLNVGTTTSTTAECVRSYGNTTINGGTFTATAKTTTAYGINALGGTVTVTDGTFNIVATTNTAYGVVAQGEINANYGYKRESNVIIQGGTFNVETKGGSTAYGAYAWGSKKNITPSKVTGASSMDMAAAGTLTISNGTFNVKASTNTSVYGIVVAGKQTQGEVVATPTASISDGKFNINGATSSSGAINSSALAANVTITGGHYSSNTGLSKYVTTPKHVHACKHEELKTTYPYEVSDMYTITFDSNGGSEVAPITQAYNTAVTAPADPTREGYTFGSWSPAVPQTMPAADKTCVAQWTANNYTITFDSNGGTAVPSITQPYLSAVTAPADPTREGYTFDGWDPEVPPTMPLNGRTCVAQWQVIPEVHTAVEVVGEAEYTDMLITATGSVNVTNGSSLTVNNLYIQANAEASGELFGKGTIAVDNAYMDYTFTGRAYNRADQNWYAFAVPFEVDAEALKYKKANGDYADCGLGTAIDIIYYSGAIRASQGVRANAWEYVEDQSDKTLKPGTLYLATFSKDEYVSTVRFTKKAASALISSNTITTSSHPAAITTDANWNGIANPNLYYSTLTNCSTSVGQIYSYDDEKKENVYSVVTLSNEALSVGKPIFIQTTASSATASQTDRPSAAPKRMLANTDTKSALVDVRIIAEGNNKYSDRLFLATDEEAKNEYTIGADLLKAGVATKRAQMWVDNYNQKLCLNTIVPVENVAEYALGISAPVVGDYVIEQASVNEGTLYLIHNGEAIWNLSEMPYTLFLEAGTNSEYGLRWVKTTPGIVTDLGEAAANAKQGDTKKLIMDNHLLIINNGRVYDAQGQQL